MTREELRQELKEQGYIDVLWHKDDVVAVLEENNHTYTDEDVDNIVADIVKFFNAEVGISWEVIDSFVWMYFNDKQDDTEKEEGL